MTKVAFGSAKQAAAAPVRRGDAIDQWLAMFARFLHLPAEQSRAIRDELDSHMRDRVRDLMLGGEGLSEDEGMRRAIDELGEAAELAAHFRAAHKPNRRLAMSIAAIGVAAGAAVISVVALTQAQPASKPSETPPMADAAGMHRPLVHAQVAHPEIAHPQMVDPRAVEPAGAVPVLSNIPIVNRLFAGSHAAPPTDTTVIPAQLSGVRIDAEMKNTNVREVAELFAKKAELKLSLRTDPGFDARAGIESIQFVDDDLASAFRRLNAVLDLTVQSRLDFRVRDGVFEVAPRATFDRLESTLVAYDLTDAFNAQASVDGLINVMTQFVENDGWRDNGGSTARLKVVGTKMFVEAPPRYHERVAWILSQFGRKPSKSSQAPVNLAPVPGMGGGTAAAAAEAAPAGGMAAMSAGGGAPFGGGSAAGMSAATGRPGAANSAAAVVGGSPFAGGDVGSAPAANDAAPKPPSR